MSRTERSSLPDLPTVIAIALVVYALANLLHEGAGHGGACLLVGGRPLQLSSVHFEYDEEHLSVSRQKVVSAAGTLVNFASALIALPFLFRARSTRWRYFLWLFVTIHLLMGSGYFLFSGLGKIGDWANVCQGLPEGIWRPSLAIVGAALYVGIAKLASKWLLPLIGGGADAMRRASRLTVAPYIAGGLLYCISGLFNPHGWKLIVISAAAASFGGTSALLWLKEFQRDAATASSAEAPPLERSWGWIVSAIVLSAIFICVFGPAVKL